ncbi:MAG: ABC transporter permease [Ktedonobacteraceae bacterium]|nr:ABC transporter permease [Ktedonobacteraceae bacterium]
MESNTTSIEYRPGSSTAAAPVQQILRQTLFELLLTLRRGENILVTLLVPVALLIFFASLNIAPAVNGSAINFLLPGILALAIIAAGMVNLGIATAYERYYGVLKRLGSSPLSRGGLIMAKVISILLLEIIQVLLLVGVAVALYGWRPAGSAGLALLVIALGTVTFSALGLAMAGALRAELTLGGANALFLLFMLIGGGILPLDHLPGPLADVAQILPAAALTQALQASMTSGTAFPTFPLITLAVWAIIILLVAIRTFKWE